MQQFDRLPSSSSSSSMDEAGRGGSSSGGSERGHELHDVRRRSRPKLLTANDENFAGRGSGRGSGSAGAGSGGSSSSARAEKAGLGGPSPEPTASFFATITFWWLEALIRFGHKFPLMQEHLFLLRPMDRARVASGSFVEAWTQVVNAILESELSREEQQARAESPWPLVHSLRGAYGSFYSIAAVFKLVQDLVQFSGPLLLAQMVVYMQNPRKPTYLGYLYVLGFFVAKLIQTVCINQYFHRCFRTGMHVRAALIGALYTKALRLSSTARGGYSVGQITNLMANDVSRIQRYLQFGHLLWSCPLQIAVALVLLFRAIGWSALAGVCVMIALVPIQKWVGKKLSSLRSSIVKFTDARVMAMNEILQGIRILKFYGWEQEFHSKVDAIREDETDVLRQQASYNAVNYFVMGVSMLVVSSVTYIVYALTNDPLEPGAIFSSMALFGLLWFPISFLPAVLNMVIETKVAVARVSAFLNADELPGCETRAPGLPTPPYISSSATVRSPAAAEAEAEADAAFAADLAPGAIAMELGTFGWDPESAVPTLADVSLSISPGSLVMVVGRVGAGKSTFLSALLGEVPRRSGRVHVEGSIAYAPQEAWVMNATLMDNVLFGRKHEYNACVRDAETNGADSTMVSEYVRTLRATALLPDLAILPAGDSTEIGEKGINLSGGQKARVSLARAVFSDADIVLLDDPLSAVDVHVGRHIFEKTIMEPSVLGNKTRILVTHHLQYLPFADQIVVLENGSVSHVGTYAELTASGVDFFSFAEEEEGDDASQTGEDGAASPGLDGFGAGGEFEDAVEVVHAKDDSLRGVTLGESLGVRAHDESDEDTPAAGATLMTTEERNVGAVKWRVYLYYLRAFGGVLMGIAILVLYIGAEATRVSQDYWLAKWASDSNSSLSKYLPTYVLLGAANATALLIRALLFAKGGVAASRVLHARLFANILRAPMSFFDTTPIGRVLSRFSKDIDSIDNSLPKTLHSLGSTFFRCLATLVLVAVIIPWFLVPCVPIIVAYLVVQQYYRRTSRELKRLDSVSRSPVYALFSETLTGATTIRAYGLESHFADASATTVDANHRAYILSMSANRWLSVRLELLGNLLVVFTALLCVIERGNIDPGLVGLVIAYTLRITDSLNWTVRMATQAEVESNSVERVMYYTLNVETEPAAVVPEYRAPPGWPRSGAITFDDVTMRYRPDLEPALSHCSFTIPAGSKVGVIGRTGSGKSSTALCLFRLVEIDSGNILIDGMNIARMGLDDLRRSLAIIPQSPVMFSGTVRSNLDPFDAHTDDELWTSLERAHMADTVRDKEHALDAEVTENGENFSVGERQLLCLARALLRRSSIVIADEATSATDKVTDALIQSTIRTEFADATVYSIAHRLDSVLASDLVLVMDSGRVAEFDTPLNLLARPDSMFTSMVDETGPTQAAYLRAIARGEIDPLADADASIAARAGSLE